MGTPPIGPDGLRARGNGEYAERKLVFLNHYLPYALTATARKRHRVYVDLFAGPGINVDGANAFESGALRALKAQGRGNPSPTFTDVYLVNIDADDHAALERRVDVLCSSGECQVPRARIRVMLGDANELIPSILSQVRPQAYLMVFADIQGPTNLPWRSVEALRAQGHRSMDFYMLFPLEMAINRMLAYEHDRNEQYAEQLTAFFGTDAWQAIAATRLTDAQSRECKIQIEALYCTQLEKLWDKAGKLFDVHLRGDQKLYRMLFAASHEAAHRIARAAAHLVQDTGQIELL